MPARTFIKLIALLSIASLACNQPFDPRQPLQDQLVVFSILSTDRATQFVRVERNYMPAEYDALAYVSENSVDDVIVTLNDGRTIFRLRDTTFQRPDTTRFKFPIHAHIVSPLTVEYGRLYEITVESPKFGRAFGTASVPTKPMLVLGAAGSNVLENPGSHQGDEVIPFELLLSSNVKGYVGRLFIDYSVFENAGWIAGRIEVPVRYTYAGLTDYRYVAYAQLARRPSTQLFVTEYTNQMYNAALIQIAYVRYPKSRIIFNRIVYQLLQVEQNLYDYYKLSHAYDDYRSMRLDEPSYSNIVGGIGLVGAYTVDSLVHVLPEYFAYNRL